MRTVVLLKKIKMKKAIFLLCSLVVLVFTVINCNTGVSLDKGDGKLFNTRWKLVGFFDVEKNEFSELEVKNCVHCYILNFQQDSTVVENDKRYWVSWGKLETVSFGAYYIVDYIRSTIIFELIARHASEDTYDGEKYYEALVDVRTFERNGDELKLYYNDGKNYLLFGKRQ